MSTNAIHLVFGSFTGATVVTASWYRGCWQSQTQGSWAGRYWMTPRPHNGMVGLHSIGSHLWWCPGAPCPLSSPKFLLGVWQPTVTARCRDGAHGVRNLDVCVLAYGRREPRSKHIPSQQEGFALELPNSCSPRKSSEATMPIPVLLKWGQTAALPWHVRY